MNAWRPAFSLLLLAVTRWTRFNCMPWTLPGPTADGGRVHYCRGDRPYRPSIPQPRRPRHIRLSHQVSTHLEIRIKLLHIVLTGPAWKLYIGSPSSSQSTGMHMSGGNCLVVSVLHCTLVCMSNKRRGDEWIYWPVGLHM